MTVTTVEFYKRLPLPKCCFVSLFLQKVTFYGSSLVDSGAAAKGQPLEITGASRPGMVTKTGLVLFGNDGKAVSQLKLGTHLKYFFT